MVVILFNKFRFQFDKAARWLAESLNDAYAARGIEPVKHAVGIFTPLFQYLFNRFLNSTDK